MMLLLSKSISLHGLADALNQIMLNNIIKVIQHQTVCVIKIIMVWIYLMIFV